MKIEANFQPSTPAPGPGYTGFSEKLRNAGKHPLASRTVKVLQVNVGYRCNMTCAHCHVSAGPRREEVMGNDTVEAVLAALRRSPVQTLDITGGAPELNPRLRHLVREAKGAGKGVIVRTNLTILTEPGMTDLPEFYRQHEAELIASLPCYLERNVETTRGRGVYARSIEALQTLNALGYGREGSGSVPLSLVYNPAGAFLPPDQSMLEADYKRELLARFGISFTRLYAFTNMPIGRFRDSLARSGELERYQGLLANAFNPSTLDRLMCRDILSVGWDGKLYDCDFNQAVGLAAGPGGHSRINDFDYDALSRRLINVDDHCYGCTAGQGSS